MLVIYTNKSGFLYFLKSRFHFDIAESIARSWTLRNLGRKWKDFKGRLWHEFNDSSLSVVEMYEKVPHGVPRDQWKKFVDKNNEDKYKVMSNASLFNQTIYTYVSNNDSLLL